MAKTKQAPQDRYPWIVAHSLSGEVSRRFMDEMDAERCADELAQSYGAGRYKVYSREYHAKLWPHGGGR